MEFKRLKRLHRYSHGSTRKTNKWYMGFKTGKKIRATLTASGKFPLKGSYGDTFRQLKEDSEENL